MRAGMTSAFIASSTSAIAAPVVRARRSVAASPSTRGREVVARARASPWISRDDVRRTNDASSRNVSLSAMSSSSSADENPSNESTAGKTRLQRIVDNFRLSTGRRARRNLKKLPLALICLLVGFSICALLPHPESPQDAFITFTIIVLTEFASSILYGNENQGGLLRWLKEGEFLPVAINCFKIGVMYGLFVDAFKVGS